MENFNLNKTPKVNNGFKVPDQYFEQLEHKIIHQTVAKDKKIRLLTNNKQFWFSSIAAAILISLALPIYNNMAKDQLLDKESLENYLTNEYYTYDIIESIPIESINNLENEISLNDDLIEDYLINTSNIDYYLNE